MTEIGDILESVWQQVVRKLIIRENETVLFKNLQSWLALPFLRDSEMAVMGYMRKKSRARLLLWS